MKADWGLVDRQWHVVLVPLIRHLALLRGRMTVNGVGSCVTSCWDAGKDEIVTVMWLKLLSLAA